MHMLGSAFITAFQLKAATHSHSLPDVTMKVLLEMQRFRQVMQSGGSSLQRHSHHSTSPIERCFASVAASCKYSQPSLHL
mmetsp:Transcript_23986/g.37605  ORF Transcript_23986/g.37605 Transcript_23986/m.37605 type:complete len:80 (-) Transcript_23986:1088-1327(-)